MKVEELIKKLQGYNPDLQVVIVGDDWSDGYEVEYVSVWRCHRKVNEEVDGGRIYMNHYGEPCAYCEGRRFFEKEPVEVLKIY